MINENEQLLRKIPSVDVLVSSPELSEYASSIPHSFLVDSIRESTDEVRQHILTEKNDIMNKQAIKQSIIYGAKRILGQFMETYYRKVINATGIILHTGLGRAVLPQKAIRQIDSELSGYSLLQSDIETGQRSRRDSRIEWLLGKLTNAEAATVVNNNAAATAIVLNTIAKDKEVIVSRGQLVEIGGSFRLPDVMAFSGAKLIEVGTTNKTHLRDYEKAITENTAAILRVHPSNYKIQGFTSGVPLDELVQIAHLKNLVMIDDVGAGALIDFSKYGFEREPTLAESIGKGADIVTASADKLIGASQAGLILGKSHLIDAVRKNQFARIVRVDKITLAALEATLRLFLDEQAALNEVPTLQMMVRKPEDIKRQAERIASKLQQSVSGADIKTIPGFSQVGSGSLPAQNLATTLVALSCEKLSIDLLAKRLRQYRTPVFSRIQNDKVLLDPRTLLDGDEKILIEAVLDILSRED